MSVKRRVRVDHELAELATRQHGVVSMRQLAGLGYAKSTVIDWRETGRLHRVHRGVYAVGHEDLMPRRSRRPYLVHCAVLSRDERAVREGIPVTSLARTYLDLAATERGRTVERMLDRAAERHLLDLGPVREMLVRHPDHPGAPKLEAALAIYRPRRKFTRSGFERRFLEVVREARLPEPAMNLFVAGHELDAYWEEERFGVELDSYATHGSRLSFEEDRVRSDDFLLAGLKVTRVTETRLDREPEKVVESLRGHLSRRAVIE